MNSSFYGESSKGCSSQEIDSDPPKLKKARFLWEVKGNYHLKEGSRKAISDKNESISQDGIITIGACTETDSNTNFVDSSISNVLKKNCGSLQNTCCFQSFLEKAEDLIHDKSREPSDICSTNDEDEETDDIHFSKWHTKQMIRYDIENKINAALETCLGDSPSKYVDLDISDIVEDVESDMEVKDEGILMAIESHGLKTNDYFNRELHEICNNKSCCDSSLSSQSNLNKSEAYSSDSNECIYDDKSLQSEVPDLSEINSKFWNTAVLAAIHNKGLTYNE